MTSTEVYQRVLYNDGEGITYGDANDAQDFLRAVVWDKLVGNLIGNVALTGTFWPDLNGQNGVDPPNHLAYCLHGGSAYLRPGSVANSVQIAPGVLLQKTANATGLAPTLLAYQFQGTEQVTIAAGDPTNPRVDLIQMQLALVNGNLQSRDFQDATTHVVTTQSMNKKVYVQCTLSVKQGTPAANPQYPDPDTGYVAVGGVVVGPTYAIGTALSFGYSQGTIIGGSGPPGGDTFPLSGLALVHDQRMPINVQALQSDPNTFRYNTAWQLYNDVSIGSNGTMATSSNATNSLDIYSPKGGYASRLVGVSFWGSHITDDSTNDGFFMAFATALKIPLNYVTSLGLGAGSGDVFIPYYTLEGQQFVNGPLCVTSTANYFHVLPSTTNKIGTPIWSNGQPSPYVVIAGGLSSGKTSQLFFRIKSGQINSFIGYFNWYWAQGI